jgi:hypothetical protein
MVMDENKPEDVDCWIGETLVSTPYGQKRIDSICVGDYVDTPIGPRKVLKSYVSGKSETVIVEFSNGVVLEGTPKHKIAIKKHGLVSLSDLKCHLIPIQRNNKWQEKLLYTKVLLTTDTMGGDTTIPMALYYRMAECLCIARYGLMHMAKYLMDIISIILTMIMTTMRFQTYNALTGSNTQNYIIKKERILEKNKNNGQILRPEKKFFKKILENAKTILQRSHRRAKIVEFISQPKVRWQNFALMIAMKNIAEILLNAQFVKKCLGQKETQKKECKPVHIIAVGRCEEKKLVYNLTVEEAHLFYVYNLVSSNTDQEDHAYDDVRYACMSRPWSQKREEIVEKRDRWLRFDREESSSNDWKII